MIPFCETALPSSAILKQKEVGWFTAQISEALSDDRLRQRGGIAIEPKQWFTVPLVGLALGVVVTAAHVDLSALVTGYRQVATIQIPGNLAGGFDISWVDSVAGRYYLADRGTTSVDVIDTKHLQYLYSIPVAAAGNGVVAIQNPHDDVIDDPETAGELWVGDSASNVEVIDLKTRSVVASISTGGVARADELAYDPLDHIVLIANDRETTCVMGVCTGGPPFVTFIDVEARIVLGRIFYPQVVFGDTPSNHGLEQPVWNPKTGMFYLAVPATSDHPNGEVDEIDPAGQQITRAFSTTCNPAGLALVPRQRLVTSCGDVIRVTTGNVLTTVAEVGADEIWFNPGEERVYFGGFQATKVPIVNTDNNKLVATLVVGQINPMPPPPSQTTHSIAADSENNLIFVPVSNAGVKVYTDRRRSVGENP
jgi:DNA-binding beta-propeller fold protein YncE